MDILVNDLAAVVESELAAPFALFGDCSGALVAFELTRELARRGLRPTRLVVASQPAPDTAASPTSTSARLSLRQRVERVGGTDPRVLENEAVFAVVARALEADLAIVDGYRYKPDSPVDVPISALAAASAADEMSRYERWESLTTAGCTVELVAAETFFSDGGWAGLGSAVGRHVARDVGRRGAAPRRVS
jgi:medium-chain acyl-[acyl-carrier-protein] hydrolase